MNDATTRRGSYAVCAVLFFFSGFAALIYELVWVRHLGLIFGNTVQAAAAVFAAYMAGLALGAALFGNKLAAAQRPTRWFAALQIAIAIYALAMPALFHELRMVYRAALQQSANAPWLAHGLRFALGFLLLLFPTACMGGTLPALAQALLRDQRRFGWGLGLLYGINTLGAALGVLAAGFVLIERIGVSGANALAAALSLIAGGMAWFLRESHPADAARGDAKENTEAQHHPVIVYTVLGAAAASGAIALALEVVWFRTLILIFGSTTYSFSAMLAIYLLGIGAGALAAGLFVDRIRSPLMAYAMVQSFIGISTLYALRWFNRFPFWMLRVLQRSGFTWTAMMTVRFLIAAAFLLAPTLCMGAAFTFLTRTMRAHTSDSSPAVGRVYAWNTVGSMLGSLLGGLVLLPWLGMERSLILLAVAAVIAGLCALILARAGGWPAAAAFFGIMVFTVGAYATHPGWSRKLMAAGPYFAPWQFISGSQIVLLDRIRSEELLYYREGIMANSSVSRSDDQKLYFSSDGKVEADTSPRSLTLQRMMGHLPLLFHPAPRKVLNIGLGAGVTFGSISCHSPEHFEVVEIEPAVLDAARHFARWNHNVMNHPKAVITLGDGRNHLFCTTNRYDVITSDPFEPVYTGANALYTVDHFRQARACLAPGGIMCQYLPLYELSPDDFSMIVRSFVNVFPDSIMFFTGDDTIMLGFTGGVAVDAPTLRRRFEVPEVKQSLAEIGVVSPEVLMAMCVADLRKPLGLFGCGPLNSDDRPYVEFSAPRNALRYTNPENIAALLEAFSPVPDEMLKGFDDDARRNITTFHNALRETLEGVALQTAGNASGAFHKYVRAHEAAPQHPIITDLLVSLIMTSADNLREDNQLDDAIYQYNMALQWRPQEFMALFHLVDLLMRTNRPGPAGDMLDRALAAYPDSALLLGLKGRYVAAISQDFAAAKGFLQQAVMRAPWKPELWRDYAMFSEAAGDLLTALAARQQAEELEKYPLTNSIER
jgi:spermidine synthase